VMEKYKAGGEDGEGEERGEKDKGCPHLPPSPSFRSYSLSLLPC
jgi:hypothetical protein